MKPSPPWREDLITSLLATTLVAGLFLDGWNHINLQNGALGSFFTVWHALLYTGFTVPLFTLPLGAIASHKAPTALMQRNLLRHVTWSMPSGQSIARAMGVEMLSAEDLGELAAYDMQLERNTPLFYYMLKEASLVPDTDIGKNSGGFHLGPVGGRIVAEVVIGLLQADPASYIVQQPGWMPTLQKPGTAFRMTDFLTFAGVDPATRHAQKPVLA